MAHVVVMPKLGNTVESCIIVKWDVAEGQEVNADTVLCEIETDKATMEVPAGVSGTVLKVLRPEGDDVPVMEPIVVIGATGESVEAALKEAGFAGAAAGAGAAEGVAAGGTSGIATTGAGPVQAAQPVQVEEADAVGVSPRAKQAAKAAGLSADAVREFVGQGTGPGGRIIERDVAKVVEEAPKLTATARGIAALNELYESGKKAGSGLGGRMTAADVAAAAAQAKTAEVKTAEANAQPKVAAA
ncbi:MAG TPA: E3 binding domain-containing protein, partial [Spirochaetales bacterium]|nr:E3 binding domain-containing protein [Spirochaetales bacterium]